MKVNDQSNEDSVAANFVDLKQSLEDFVAKAGASDQNLHFTTFRNLDREALSELTRLAHHGRTRVSDQGDYFLNHGLYDDGMFWYDLFLVISRSALSYENEAGQPVDPKDVETLVIELVLMARYSTARPGDITKRNQEALGNLLLVTRNDELRALALERATDNEIVKDFVEDTLRMVDEAAPGRTKASGEDAH